jgi:hypothetical protein
VLAGKRGPVDALVPAGLAKVTQARGDLDGDAIDDVALLVQQAPSSSGEPERAQAILLFRGDRSGQFTLWKVGTQHFVVSVPNFMEPNGLGVFQIRKGVLTAASAEAKPCRWAVGPRLVAR